MTNLTTTRQHRMSLPVTISLMVLSTLSLVANGCKPKPRNLGGEIHGFVAASFDKEIDRTATLFNVPHVRLPNIKVTAKNVVTNTLSASVMTNVYGHFITPKLASGRYQLCLDAPGYITNCGQQVFTVTSENIVLNFDPPIAPEPGAVYGRVMMADARLNPCFAEREVFSTLSAGKVWLTNGGGNQVAGPIMANSAGEYVLPKIPGPASYHLKASCDSGQGDRAVTLSAANLTGNSSFDVIINNHTPTVVQVTPTIAGKYARLANPGAVVKVSVKATDADGDALHYKWASDTPGFISIDAPTINWKLPTTAARNVIILQVTDGKGGYAFASAKVQSGPDEILFSGTVHDRSNGVPISGAEVVLNGHAVNTDANGTFQVNAPDSLRYVMNLHKLGYALLSRVFFTSATGLDLLLDPAQKTLINADTGGTINYERKVMATVKVAPGTLVDGNGHKVTGSVNGYAFAYDLDRSNPIPGDYSAKTTSAQDVRLESYGAIDVAFTDPGGQKLQLAPGAAAEISLTVHPASLTTAPAFIPLFSYDEATGYWMQQGQLRRVGNSYEGQVKHFSAFNADTVFNNFSCIEFNVADHDVPSFPFVLHVDYTSTAGGPRHNDFQVIETNNGLVRLPPNTPMTLTVYPGSGPGQINSSSPHVMGTFQWNSGPAIASNTYPVPDLSVCQGFDTAPLPGNPAKPAELILTGPAHGTFITGFAAGSQAVADAYYTQLEVLGGGTQRDTFSHWKATNGFNDNPTILVAGEANAQYFNNGDLQLGRDMHCLTTISGSPARTHIACYVSNYGSGPLIVQGDPQTGVAEAVDHSIQPAATVAMEYDDLASNPPPVSAVQFYAYKGDGSSFENPALDSEGNKFLPQNCMACHGGSYNSTNNLVNGASFLPFDVFSFYYDNRLAKLKDLDHQQEQMRQLNAIVKATNPNNTNPDNPIAQFIDGLYGWSGCNVNTPNCRAQDGPTATHPMDQGPFTPPGWQVNPPPPPASTNLYQTVPRPYCRTCHLAQSSTFPPDWTSYAQITANKGIIQSSVCNQTENNGIPNGSQKLPMPHAEVPYKAFWFSNNPSGPSFLGDPTTGIGLTPNAAGDRCPR